VAELYTLVLLLGTIYLFTKYSDTLPTFDEPDRQLLGKRFEPAVARRNAATT
jgi:hypothetical protein